MEKNRVVTVKNTIKHWIECGIYPKEFANFFLKWSLFNQYYNEISKEDREVDKVLEFSRKHESLFDQLRNEAIELVSTECVGRGRGLEPPDEWVKTATLQLRNSLGINTQLVCASCRDEKRVKCQKVNITNYEFGHMEAVIRILYQVRCNMFHGEKTDLEEFQIGRNQLLVRIGNRIIAVVLNTLIESK